jgi:hypothetical protein
LGIIANEGHLKVARNVHAVDDDDNNNDNDDDDNNNNIVFVLFFGNEIELFCTFLFLRTYSMGQSTS